MIFFLYITVHAARGTSTRLTKENITSGLGIAEGKSENWRIEIKRRNVEGKISIIRQNKNIERGKYRLQR